ncbi:ferredoxin [Frondihabitans australicus]|uniref:Ferredoxin n=1 Tax=Frondihabitans australicus TaxID=386892 RepID=A0A495IKH4_9MICO|nr:ferredoxin [Frondihabitans australicus]RKR76240.1 ferredoxin [Frondihabitans australicus]
MTGGFRPTGSGSVRAQDRRQPAAPDPSLHIDWTLCDGRGLCTELLPELLSRDEWGYPLSPDGSDVRVPPSLVPAARDAVALCPRAALRLRGVA